MARSTTSKVGSPAGQLHVKTDTTPGVAYQLTDQDPLLDEKQCTLDANMMADLGANTIRVYHVDPTQNHDACMTAFANVGIYLFLDLDTFDTQFNQVLHTLSNPLRHVPNPAFP